MKRIKGDPIKEYVQKNLEPLCFPWLFPDGFGHFYDDRKAEIRFQQYVFHRFMNADPRFRKDMIYLFFLLHHKESKMIDQGVFATYRTGKGPKLSVASLIEKLKNKDQLLEANLNNIMTCFRGSDQYWSRKASDLAAVSLKCC